LDVFEGEIEGNIVVIKDGQISQLIERGFGEYVNKVLYLSPLEAKYLVDMGKLRLKDNLNYDPKMYAVYSALRSKYLVKSGSKFGFDFRVYPRGKGIESHTEYVVKVVGENFKIKGNEIVLFNRMANTLNTRLLLAIVDDELKVTFYMVSRWMP